jgi:hypothetical protein
MTPEDLMHQCEACRDKHAACFADVEHRLTILEVTLWGQGGGNGIKGALAELTRKMDLLLRFFWIATTVPLIVAAVVAVLQFLGKL